jgi:hypothetical protein
MGVSVAVGSGVAVGSRVSVELAVGVTVAVGVAVATGVPVGRGENATVVRGVGELAIEPPSGGDCGSIANPSR